MKMVLGKKLHGFTPNRHCDTRAVTEAGFEINGKTIRGGRNVQRRGLRLVSLGLFRSGGLVGLGRRRSRGFISFGWRRSRGRGRGRRRSGRRRRSDFGGRRSRSRCRRRRRDWGRRRGWRRRGGRRCRWRPRRGLGCRRGLLLAITTSAGRQHDCQTEAKAQRE